MAARERDVNLAGQLLILQMIIIAVVVVTGTASALWYAHSDGQNGAKQRVVDVAQTLATAPEVAAALQDPARRAGIQPLAERVRGQTGVDFVVVMDTQATRYSHPDPRQIGRRFIGRVDEALKGRVLTETYTGTLGPSIRAVVPVVDGGRVVGMVSAGITTTHVGAELRRRIPAIFGVSALGFVVAACGAVLVSRRLRRQTLGLGPQEITRMYEHHDAVLHSVREGVLVFDQRRRPVLVNDEAARLLDLGDDSPLPDSLKELLDARDTVRDEVYLAAERVLVVNQQPTTRDGRVLGTVATLRDHTELETLAGELNSVRGLAEALRAQAHEAANRLHTMVTMIELGRSEEAVEFATAELASAQELTDRLLGAVHEPVLAALLLGKAAQAAERGVDLIVTDDTAVSTSGISPRDLVTVVGNLIDNAIDAVLSTPPPRRVEVTVSDEGGAFTVRVADTGTGLEPVAFTRGWSTKEDEGHGIGLSLVHQVVRRHGGEITVGKEAGAVVTVRLPSQETADL